jgi:hypothetical protein
MSARELVLLEAGTRPLALIEGLRPQGPGPRIRHFLLAAIDNANTRQAYGRALAAFFAFLEDGGARRLQDIIWRRPRCRDLLPQP